MRGNEAEQRPREARRERGISELGIPPLPVGLEPWRRCPLRSRPEILKRAAEAAKRAQLRLAPSNIKN